jgi:hypothetical protein
MTAGWSDQPGRAAGWVKKCPRAPAASSESSKARRKDLAIVMESNERDLMRHGSALSLTEAT